MSNNWLGLITPFDHLQAESFLLLVIADWTGKNSTMMNAAMERSLRPSSLFLSIPILDFNFLSYNLFFSERVTQMMSNLEICSLADFSVAFCDSTTSLDQEMELCLSPFHGKSN